MLPARWLQGLRTQQVLGLAPPDGASKGIFFIFENYLQRPRWASRGWHLVWIPSDSWCNKEAPVPFLTTSMYIGQGGGSLLSNSFYRVRIKKPGARQGLSLLVHNCILNTKYGTEHSVSTGEIFMKSTNIFINCGSAYTIIVVNIYHLYYIF